MTRSRLLGILLGAGFLLGLTGFAAPVSGASPQSSPSATLIVLSHTDNTVYELDPATGRILHQFVAPDQPHEAAIMPDGSTVFASIPAGGVVEILDGATLTKKGIIESEYFKRAPLVRPARPGAPPGPPITSSSPHGMALTRDNSKLYIGVENAEIPGVVVYDVKAGKVLKKIDLLLSGGHYLQIHQPTDKLYYPFRDDNRVAVIDTKTDRVVKIIPVKGGPVGVAFAPNGEVWFHEDDDGSVTVADTATDQVVKVIQTSGKGAGRMAVSPDGRFAASTHGTSEDVAIIDGATKAVAATVKVGKGPGFPLFSPDSTRLYVMNYGMSDVAVIDLSTMTVTARHKVGTTPFGGGVKVMAR